MNAPIERTLATDASIYQIFPIGVVVPRDEDDAKTALAIAHDMIRDGAGRNALHVARVLELALGGTP